MKRSVIWKSCMVVLVVALGSAVQYGCLGSVANINPCGTILSTSFCDPVVYSQLYGDYYEPNYDADPTCSIPFQCGVDAGG